MAATREMLLEERDGRLVLLSPEVGTFTCALPKGQLVAPGAEAGVVRTLARRTRLVAPPGAVGRIVGARPDRVQHPVGYGDVLYELAPIEGGKLAEAAGPAGAGAASDDVLLSTHAGRFWHRPAPGEPPLVEAGKVVAEGDPIGLIEVMKTFGRVLYRPTAGLPATARVVKVLVGDGAEVSVGDPLLEVEPA